MAALQFTRQTSLCIYSCLLCVWVFLSPSAFALEVTLATGINDDPPYVYGDESITKDYPGVTIEILYLIEQKTDIEFTVLKRPWARVVEGVKTNQLDGGFHFSFKEARNSFVAYPIPQGHVLPDSKYSISNRSYVLYRLNGGKTSWDGNNITSDPQKPSAIGVIRGSSIASDIRLQNHKLVEVNTDHQLLRLLLAKRIDAFIGLENMIDSNIHVLHPDQASLIEKTSPAVVSKPYYVAFSKKFYQENKQAAWAIWHTIDQIKISGELDAIFARYAGIE